MSICHVCGIDLNEDNRVDVSYGPGGVDLWCKRCDSTFPDFQARGLKQWYDMSIDMKIRKGYLKKRGILGNVITRAIGRLR